MSEEKTTDVLGALPHSRPHRRSDKRRARQTPAGASPANDTEPAAAKSSAPKPAASKPSAPKPGASKPSAPEPAASGPAASKPAGAAKPTASKPAPAARAKTKPRARTASPRLQQPKQPTGTPSRVRDAAPKDGRAGRTQPERHDLLGSAVQAAAELTELGLTIGARVIRGAVSKLPRP